LILAVEVEEEGLIEFCHVVVSPSTFLSAALAQINTCNKVTKLIAISSLIIYDWVSYLFLHIFLRFYIKEP